MATVFPELELPGLFTLWLPLLMITWKTRSMGKSTISLLYPMGNNLELGWALLIQQHDQDNVDLDRSSFSYRGPKVSPCPEFHTVRAQTTRIKRGRSEYHLMYFY